ncbi:MAG TPA: 3-oxoacyl-[acyl-carrier-protein] synthase III C-terminal domain-containing protein [Stellaceae bacterium]|jgi:alkylresorcinol/alkylpyrone synthase
MTPRLAALATAVPPFALDQDRVIALMRRMFAGSARFERLTPVFANSGIARRYSVVPFDWFERPHTWPERNRVYVAGALDLIETVAGRLLDRADMRTGDIGAVVTVSTTGIATPSLDALLIERMGLPRDVERLPIFGLGCAGGAIGLGKAATLARMMPGRAVLLLVVELCTLAFHRDDGSSDIVAAALFGDGAAGALLRCGGTGPAVVANGEHTWPASLDVMGWDIVADGFKAIFSRDVPALVADGLGAAARGFLARHGLATGDIDRFVCHPGGPKVIAACEAALGVSENSLGDARAVLREFGNMSAPSVLFVLERMLAAGGAWQHALVAALGPGFTAGLTLLSRE